MNNENEIVVPETVKPQLRPFWRFWNIGHYKYFKTEKTIGKAKFEPYIIDEQGESLERLRATFSASQGGRYVPQGEYVRLFKFQKDAYDINTDELWQVVMSDTPDEFNDHLEPILNAHGRVLIHGLGLGCVLNCIRMRPDVKHVDVVEVDEDVLNLISPFYKGDKRVEFHLGSCVDIKWPTGTRWNYVWHDIWTTISPSNLTNDSEAEHGISYARLHRMFGNRCDTQGSWAFDKAQKMRKVEMIQLEIAASWAYAWSIRPFDKRLEMLIEATCPPMWPMEQWKSMFMNEKIREHMNSQDMYDRYRQRAMKSKMETGEAYIILEDKSQRYAMQKVGMI